MKILFTLLAILCFSLPARVLAFGHITLVDEYYKDGSAAGTVPYADGLKDPNLQVNLNHLIKEKANELGRRAGGKAALSYEVTVNRPTLFSLVLKAEGNKTVYSGLNLDAIHGTLLEDRDLLYTNAPDYKNTLEGKKFVYGDDGIHVAGAEDGPYDTVVPYTAILKAIDVAEGARLLTSYKITQNAQDMTLRLKAGELIAMYLDANPTSGNNWVLVDKSAQPGFLNLGHSFYLPMQNPTGAAGSPGTTILFCSFANPGDYTVRALYTKSMSTPLRDYVFKFHVE